MVLHRYLTKYIVEDLQEKMVFVSGPRQVGKTTLCNRLVANFFKKTDYLNWDNRLDRKKILHTRWQSDAELIIFDEIHKYKKWKNFIKGEYDKFNENYKFLITGSARLDYFRKSGDSLQGRYHSYILHPFTLKEAMAGEGYPEPFKELTFSDSKKDLLDLLYKFGGFPEPFIKQSERHLRRWHNEKIDRLFKEEIRELSFIREISGLKILTDILPEKVGSLFSINSLREDLEVSHKAIQHWVDLLESFYYCYRIYPYTSNTIRSLKKEPKIYLWDWSEIEEPSYKFENLIAGHLLKTVHFLNNYEGYKTQLWFLRDKEKREVDFLVTVDNKPWFSVEVKLKDTTVSKHLFYFKEKLSIPFSYQVVYEEGIDFIKDGVRVISASKFLTGLI